MRDKFVCARASEIRDGAEVVWFPSLHGLDAIQALLNICNATDGWHGLWVSRAGSVDWGVHDPWCIVRESSLLPKQSATNAPTDQLIEARELILAWEADRDAFHASPGAVDFCHNLTPERSEAWSALLRAKVAASKRSQDEQTRVVVDNDMDHLLKDVP
jgi:hypothetical protein